jgi:hypothetical protein
VLLFKHLHVGAFGYLFQPLARPTRCDPSRDVQWDVRVVLIIELDELCKCGENGLPDHGVGARQQDRELVATDARDPSRLLDQRVKNFACPAQQRVAGGVAEFVIGDPQAVDVGDDDGDRMQALALEPIELFDIERAI